MCTDSFKESLLGYLYGELAPEERRAFDAHLKTCQPCRVELAELRGVRDDLLAWAPPECRDLPSSWAVSPIAEPAPMARLRAWMPAFGLAAAAMLVLATSAAIANIEVRYGTDGLIVRTGRTVTSADVVNANAAPASAGFAPIGQGVTQADLAALEQRVMASFAPATERSGMQTVALTSDNPQLSRDVRRLIEESERRTRQEMADRFLAIVSDVEGHRRADMLRVQQALGQVQSRTGAELAQTRDAVNRLLLVSQNQGQTPQR